MAEATFEIKTCHGWNTVVACTHADTEVMIPEEISGRPVEAIGAGAFLNDRQLTAVYLPDTVRRIDDSAFQGCSELRRARLPKQADMLGAFAFADCEGLEEIQLPEGLQIVGYGCFSTCTALEHVSFPKELRIIANRAFAECRALKRIELPEGLTEIGNAAFSNCLSLEAPQLPKSIRSIGDSAFFRSALAGTAYEEIFLPSGLGLMGTRAYRSRRLVFEGKTDMGPISPETRVIRAPLIDPSVFADLNALIPACIGFAEMIEDGVEMAAGIIEAYRAIIRENAFEFYEAASVHDALLREMIRTEVIPPEDIGEMIEMCSGKTEALAALVDYGKKIPAEDFSTFMIETIE